VCAVDCGFVSTSLNKETPIQYMSCTAANVGDNESDRSIPNVLWTLKTSGESDSAYHRGANIQLLSQFAGEEEVVFPPCTMMVVEERRHQSTYKQHDSDVDPIGARSEAVSEMGAISETVSKKGAISKSVSKKLDRIVDCLCDNKSDSAYQQGGNIQHTRTMMVVEERQDQSTCEQQGSGFVPIEAMSKTANKRLDRMNRFCISEESGLTLKVWR